MAFKFGKRSLEQLNTCHSVLQDIAFEARQVLDFTVLEGFRPNHVQDEMFRTGRSKLKGGQSKHNQAPSLAMDLAPYPIDWANRERFILLAGIIKGVAATKGVRIRWGGDWDSDNDMYDQTFNDLPHFELVDIK